ncbi:protein phosphatase methylesterase 1 [Tribolium castaneum]|uniref:Protein phosphatase methylesterase 1 n=1 Tax=Tribolium castaneum TaxID=7070 RepID=D6W855_TRICA|nr:PREDICTED: protein phosphatase methylesterase 1 [Tribolium castaneum]EFA10997.1 Protein phosphatase methylesterase 1-like Protein [Tribolium castaneum]|eukprot:XP_972737.1 PREDICTED: protein phosphatase methylesterase 1 [Tribolium castaneum]
MSNLRKAVLGRNAKRIGLAPNQQDFAPLKWDQYFDSEDDVTTDSGTFHVYKKGDSGPAVVCLHGGGYSGLTWALFAVEITTNIECQVIAIDLRGHGNTRSGDDSDLSLETLSQDVVMVLSTIFSEEEPPVVFVGHSMGGAVAVQCAHMVKTLGLCVIDVVEGTALDALSSMQSILRGRPTTFKSVQHAIQWCYKGGQTHNIEAAKVSMPGQIISIQSGNLAANECDTIELKPAEELSAPVRKQTPATPTIEEDDESNCSDCGKPPLPKSAKTEPGSGEDGPKYTWRIDLSKTERFWTGWFKGLSQKFLDLRIPKLLLLANIHGLDTALTVGQMQGKFQLQVLSKSGHAIHEDQPHQVAEIIGGYLVKQKIANAKVDLVCPMPGC